VIAGQDGCDVRRGASEPAAAATWDEVAQGSSPAAGQDSQLPVVPRYHTLTGAPETAPGPRTALPRIAASGLSRAQLAGRRCAVPGCRRWFALSRSSSPGVIGVTTDGRPVRACGDHDPGAVMVPVPLIPGSLAGPRRVPRAANEHLG
jgi:hypothetical protein